MFKCFIAGFVSLLNFRFISKTKKFEIFLRQHKGSYMSDVTLSVSKAIKEYKNNA